MDDLYMQRALKLAKEGRGKTSPNPLVGAVIVKNGNIIGEGFHAKAGEDHAEIAALKICTEPASGATLYTTLEPCSHQGRTPPCTDALLSAGISRVVVACKDPNPLTNGLKILREKGVEIKLGVLENEAQELNKVFFKYIVTGEPYIYLKAALTLDGKIATKSMDSQWISCEESRNWVHRKRREVDAIVVGKNTVLRDNPRLNSRLETTTYPKRIVLARKDDIPRDLQIFNQDGETIIITQDDFRHAIANQGITSMLVEGGSAIFSKFISERLVDEFYFFIAPKLVGDQHAIPLFANQNINKIADSLQLKFTNVEKIGDDILITARYKVL